MSKIDKKYHKLLKTILKKGYEYEDPNRKGINRIEIADYKIKHDFKDGFPAITTKKLYWKGVVGELLWFLRGEANIKYLVHNGINIWNKDAYNYYLKQYNLNNWQHNKLTLAEFIENIKKGNLIISGVKPYKLGDLGRIYGAQWRKWTRVKHYQKWDYAYYDDTIDQISNLIKELKKNPMGTRHIVTAWNSAELDSMALPPCHWSFEILVEPLTFAQRKKLYIQNYIDKDLKYGKGISESYLQEANIPKYQFTLKWHQRSVDSFLGLPFNIASYALLAKIIGKLTNMIPKQIVGDLSNVHIYKSHLKVVKEQLSRDINKYDKCELEDFNGFKMDMYGDIDQLLDLKEIKDFKLNNYKSYPPIKADMLAYNK